MSNRTDSLPTPIRRIVENQEILLAVGVTWLLAPALLALAGFYLGTICNDPHVRDLQVSNMVNALPFALVGLVIGVVFAVYISITYPATWAREANLVHEDEPIDEMEKASDIVPHEHWE